MVVVLHGGVAILGVIFVPVQLEVKPCDYTIMAFSWIALQILKLTLGMVAPDVEIDDGKGTILISSEEGETDGKFYSQTSQFYI